MSIIETTSMMNDVGINISQLHILLRIRRQKIGANFFKPESKIIDLCGEMIVSQFGECNYLHELDSKPELILHCVRDSTAIFKKEITLLINSKQLKVNEISRIDVIAGGDHCQGVFRISMKYCLL